jgi:integrase/recombinase XerD
VTHLRQMMLDELQRRNYSPNTVRSYIDAVEDFSKYFRRSPDLLGPDDIRKYQVHLFRDRKLSPGTIEGHTAALRFLFVKTLRRPYVPDQIPFPKCPRKLPTVLSQEEVARLIDSAPNLLHHTMLMTLYETGLRRAELCHLKVSDIDSEHMVIHVRQGKGSREFPGTVKRLAGRPAHHREDRLAGRERGRQGCRLPLTCWRPAPTRAPSKFFSDMPSSPTPPKSLPGR